MEWNNQKVLEFIKHYEAESVLWNLRDPRNKKKHLLYEAYVRIKKNLSWPTTVEDLKKKKDSLLAYYRMHLNKIKTSVQCGVSLNDLEQPNWFAFSALDCFLRPVYDSQLTIRAQEEGREPKLKKPRHNNFTIVKKCCVNLVKKHGRSVTLFDDLAFRELIDLIPMTQSEKQTLTSKYIQSLLDDDQLSDQTDTETMDKTTDDIGAYDDDDNPLQEIKGEIEPIPCTCGKDTDESMRRHTTECPASSQQTYWNFFEVALDNATCQICKKTLTWRDISTLKEHLQNKHPSVDFLDDDEGFRKGPPSEDESTNDFDMEEVYLDEAILENEQTASAAKRRKKRATAPLNITGPITRENIAASLQRFKSLDSFGQYVASLMKLIPKDKCIKFQIQIVERLLQEQAAAG